jgi:hypothetical protein
VVHVVQGLQVVPGRLVELVLLRVLVVIFGRLVLQMLVEWRDGWS